MKLDEIMKSDKVFLTPADIAEVLECTPQYIRLAARNNPERLGFPVSVIGIHEDGHVARVKIPRMPFINYIMGNNQETEGAE